MIIECNHGRRAGFPAIRPTDPRSFALRSLDTTAPALYLSKARGKVFQCALLQRCFRLVARQVD